MDTVRTHWLIPIPINSPDPVPRGGLEVAYDAGRSELDEFFDEVDYSGLVEAGKTHSVTRVVHRCDSGAVISLCFPGYKAHDRGTTDYRVDIEKETQTSLSHANIILDVYSKCQSGRVDPEEMRTYLERTAEDGRDVIGDLPPSMQNYARGDPSDRDLIETVASGHPAGDSFNRHGNQWDLDVEELTHSMFWIVLQEDINYPMPKYEGRKMPFSRYMEAVWAAHQNDESLLKKVIKRALAKGHRPDPWPEVDYGSIANLG